MRNIFRLPLLAALFINASAGEPREIPLAFGSYTHPAPADFAQAKTFRSSDRIVGTYYFYWYDFESKTHIIDHDGTDALTTHPIDLRTVSWKSVAWHKRQLEDM